MFITVLVYSQDMTSHLFGLVLFSVAWGHKALRVHLHGFEVGGCLTRRGRHTLHLQERLDVLDLCPVGAVGHRLPLGGQDAGSLPLGVLILLYSQRAKNKYSDRKIRINCICDAPFLHSRRYSTGKITILKSNVH